MSKNCTNDGCSCTPNMSIKCSVTSCAHHCQDMDNCGLSASRWVPMRPTPPWTSAPTARASARSDPIALILILD